MDCITTVVSDDYENFDIIWEQTRRLGALRGIEFTESEVAEAVGKAVERGRIEGFLLSSREPHSTKIDYSSEKLNELWFYITAEAKRTVKSIPELSGEGAQVTDPT